MAANQQGIILSHIENSFVLSKDALFSAVHLWVILRKTLLILVPGPRIVLDRWGGYRYWRYYYVIILTHCSFVKLG